MKMQIKSWLTGETLYEGEAETMRDLVGSAVKNKADLRFADLSSANLRFADLRFADLSSANLSSADLRSADLRSADLSSADLSSADLSSANLGGMHILSFSGVGSALRTTTYWVEANKIWCGCFTGTPTEFIRKVKATHANNPRHLAEYYAGIRFLRDCKRAIPEKERDAGRLAYAEMMKKSGEKEAARTQGGN